MWHAAPFRYELNVIFKQIKYDYKTRAVCASLATSSIAVVSVAFLVGNSVREFQSIWSQGEVNLGSGLGTL